jgi:Kazal-type serine protease inhibitor domain
MIATLVRRLALSLAFALTLVLLAPVSASAAGQVCGGFFGLPCGAKEFCQFPAGRCGWFDITGRCTRVPQLCPLIFRPVCGCDGKTYSNDCIRQVAKVSKKHDGRCRPTT